MSAYFLVEGKAEGIIYPAWLRSLKPHWVRSTQHNETADGQYLLMTGGGQPNILRDALRNAISEVNENSSFNELVLVLDAESEDVAAMTEIVDR